MRTAFAILMTLVVAPVAHAQAPARLGPEALEELRAAAERTHSDAVVIFQYGVLVADWSFGEERRPIEIMSVLKSVVSLGVGRLLTVGQIDSLDQPVHTFYPEWKQGRKQDITIRHLLNHTSGLQNVPNAGAEIYPSPNAIELALAAELESDPGSTFSYNNKAVNLLAGIIEKASGQRMDRFFVNEFFRAMDIDRYQWYFDASGNPHAMAGLRLLARDLAKFGQLVLDRGMWEGERLVSESYIETMLARGQPYDSRFGLLWWRFPREAAERASAGEDDDIVAYYGDGYLGQTLLVIPDYGIVAVRQVAGGSDYDSDTDGFSEFKEMVLDAAADCCGDVRP